MENKEPAVSSDRPLKEKFELKKSFPAKVAAFILCVLMILSTVLIAAAVVVINGAEFYTRDKEIIKEETFSYYIYSDVRRVTDGIIAGETVDFENTIGKSNLTCRIIDIDTQDIIFNNHYSIGGHEYYEQEVLSADTQGLKITAYIDKEFPVYDQYSFINSLINTGYALRYWVYAIALLSLIAAICMFVFLMCSAGHRAGQSGIKGSVLTRIPLELLIVAVGAVIILLFIMASEISYNYYYAVGIIAIVFACIAALSVFIGLCMNIAARVKLGKWWLNTLIYMILHLIWRILRAIGHGIACLFINLPLIWKTVLFMIAAAIYCFIAALFDDFSSRITAWLIGILIVFAGTSYSAIVLRKLQLAGRKIAQGDLSYRVDTSKMLWDFKEHGENLNSIGLGMTRAVDERMKSERMKTELITNVSHDIKTPLTSIINYVDLISKEECGNEKIKEYTQVLSRQSERLKKLIEDLVEASKVSTGNVELTLAPCDVGVLLSQTAGEYETRLSDCSLEMIVTKPEAPVMIMADGGLLWRVFNNLMNNIVKYSQPDTRVYLTLENKGSEVMISFKNISKYPLNISAEELMERFIRGDRSRHTEGSGLGLSIAKSLIELQNGSLELIIDGDFFKVNLRFKSI